MLTKPLILAIITAGSVPSTAATTEPPPTEQPDAPPEQPDKPEVNDQHWCCESVDHETKTGDGCSAISGSLEILNVCANVLYCPGYWTKEDGTVQCG